MITGFLILSLCTAASTLFGLARYKKKKNRVAYYSACVRLTERLIAEVSFRRDNLFALLKEFTAEESGELGEQINAFLAAPYAPFTPPGTLLTKADKQLLCAFLASLGQSDAKTQIFELNAYQKRFEEKCAVEREAFKKSAGVELKLFFLCGLAVGILIL